MHPRAKTWTEAAEIVESRSRPSHSRDRDTKRNNSKDIQRAEWDRSTGDDYMTVAEQRRARWEKSVK